MVGLTLSALQHIVFDLLSFCFSRTVDYISYMCNPTFNQAGVFIHGFRFILIMLSCARSTDFAVNLAWIKVVCSILVLLILVHWSELWVGCEMNINLKRNSQVLDFDKGKKPLWACWNTHLWVDGYFGSTLKIKCLQKRLPILMCLTFNIYIYI